jgi:hypothetical protein
MFKCLGEKSLKIQITVYVNLYIIADSLLSNIHSASNENEMRSFLFRDIPGKNIYVEETSEKVFRLIHHAIAAVINRNLLRLACGPGYTKLRHRFSINDCFKSTLTRGALLCEG